MKSTVTHFLIFTFSIIFINYNSEAQNNNDIIMNKLEGLERDIRDVQRSIYQSKEGELDIPLDNLNNDNSAVTKGLANHELRLIEMEEQYRKTNGLIEELNFKITQLEKENTSLKKSIDDLIDNLNNSEANTNVNSNNTELNNVTNDSQNEISNEGILAIINPDGQDEIIKNEATTDLPQNLNDNMSNNQETISNILDPKEIYQRAYNLLSKGEYEAAETAFTKFIKEYPNNELSSNAYYWLGETFYVRRNYQLAAYNFAAGYKEFPNGSKAADQLLKLGISLYSLDKLTESCATLKKLDEEFPEMPSRILNRANSFKERLECK